MAGWAKRKQAWRAGVFAAALAVSPAALAQSAFEFQEPDANAPALIDADAIEQDDERRVVVATGDVTVVQGARALSADRIEYFLEEDRVVAIGDVVLLEPDGQVVNARRAELTGGLKRAVAESLGVRFADGSRMVGRTVERESGVGTTLVDGAFTPCAPCAEDPERAPLWRLRARKAYHDEAARDIEYEDVTLDIGGVPVAYLPYFSHPDPTVRRRTGFLSPSLYLGGEFDAFVQVPYFWNIRPNVDLTFQPYITARSAPVAAAEYRHLFERGFFRFDGSAGVLKRISNNGQEERDVLRGHAFVDGVVAIDETWRATLSAKLASDDSYLETFEIDSADVLRSQLAAEGFWQESYMRVGGFAAQDLRENVGQNETPFALPELHAAYRGQPGPFGNAFARLDARSLVRDKGSEGQAVSATLGWEREFLSAGGHLLDLTGLIRADAFDTSDAQASGAKENGGTAGRVMPKLAAGWSFPLIQDNSWGAFVIAPKAQIVLAPDGARDRDIPNEDARAVEFDDANIFSLDRFPGFDRADDGQRIDYGLTMTAFFEGGGEAMGFIGQSTARKEGEFAKAAGMSGRSSDIVAAATVTPAKWLDLSWRARLAKQDLDIRRNEIGFVAGPDWLRFDAAYVEAEPELQGPEASFAAEQLTAGVAIKLDDYWRVTARHRHDLNSDRALFFGGGIGYQDECLTIDLGFGRDFASQADGGGREDTVFLRITFKHLGGLGISQGVGDNRGDR